MTWQRIMEYAHNGIELKPIPGVPQPDISGDDSGAIADNSDDGVGRDRPRTLSRAMTEFILKLAEDFEQAVPIGTDNLTVASAGER